MQIIKELFIRHHGDQFECIVQLISAACALLMVLLSHKGGSNDIFRYWDGICIVRNSQVASTRYLEW